MIKRTIYLVFTVLTVMFAAAGCRGAEGPAGQAETAASEGAASESDSSGSTASDSASSISASSESAASESVPDALTIPIRQINQHGTLILNTSFDEMKAGGMEIGDLITVYVGGKEYALPVGTSYTDVDSGEMLCRFDLEDNEVALAVNLGSFAESTGIAEKQKIAEDPGYKWETNVDEVRLSLKEKEGYLDEYNSRNLSRSDVRADYPDLSDEEFANFRAVSVSGMKENVLFRSSTPIEPAIGRNEYAMAAMEKAGIRSVINLDDSIETMHGYSTFPDSYYSRCAIINPEMSYDFGGEDFAEKVRDSVLFITESDGPWLIHCKEGKDRTGILCAILECYAGASAEEVAQDYMITYSNYYHVDPEDTTYSILLNKNLVKTLCGLFQIDNVETADLGEAASQYLLSTGLTQDQLDLLGEKLLKEQTE